MQRAADDEDLLAPRWKSAGAEAARDCRSEGWQPERVVPVMVEPARKRTQCRGHDRIELRRSRQGSDPQVEPSRGKDAVSGGAMAAGHGHPAPRSLSAAEVAVASQPVVRRGDRGPADPEC